MKPLPLRICVTTLTGYKLPFGSPRVLGVAAALAEVLASTGQAIQTDKVYRALRADSAYCQVLDLPPSFGFGQFLKVVLTLSIAE